MHSSVVTDVLAIREFLTLSYYRNTLTLLRLEIQASPSVVTPDPSDSPGRPSECQSALTRSYCIVFLRYFPQK